MRTRIVLGVFLLGPVGIVISCSNDDRSPFVPKPAPEASLPETKEPTDGSTPDARGPFDPSEEAVRCEASLCVTQIAAGEAHFCARLSDGTVRCWGDDQKGQLGGGDAGLGGVTQISAAGATTCVRVDDGGVLCWGSNADGVLGHAIDDAPHPLPVSIAFASISNVAAARVDVGQRSACATAVTGTSYCWGNDESAQLARGEPGGPGSSPGPAELGIVVKRTSAGIDTGFALADDGRLFTWGAVAGPLGVLAGRISSVTPTPIPSPVNLAPVSSLAVSGPTPGLIPPGSVPGDIPPPNQHACAVTKGDVYCWGKSEHGALGSGLPDSVIRLPTFAPLRTRAYAQQIAAGGETTCARLTDGTIACTGENERGQLGIGTAGRFTSTFTSVSTLAGPAVHVAVAKETVCALMQGGTVACWGGNARGELGLGARDDRAHTSPEKVPF